MDDQSDEDLLTAAKGGDKQAEGALFSRYMDLLYGVALKYLKNATKAEDAVMEIFQKYQTKIKTHDIETFRPWLYVLAKNHCLEQLRKEKRVREKEESYQSVQFHPFEHPDDEDTKEAQLTKMEECIETLKTDQKELIKQFYLEQRSYKEISTSTGLTWAKVRSNIQNGRRNLKNCMEKS